MNVRVRTALPGEEALLTELCMRSKAHHGYDEAFIPVEGGRESRYEDGVFLTAGQHKGQMLHALLQKTATPLPAVILMADDKQILLSSQIDPSEDDPTSDGIFRAGVLANVLQLLKLPDGTVKVLVEGRERVRIVEFIENDELVEVTPNAIRLRKRHLDPHERKRAARSQTDA